MNFTLTSGAGAATTSIAPDWHRVYLPLVLKLVGSGETPPLPSTGPPPGADVESSPPLEDLSPPSEPPPEVDLDDDPPIGDGPSLPPPEIDQQTKPPLE